MAVSNSTSKTSRNIESAFDNMKSAATDMGETMSETASSMADDARSKISQTAHNIQDSASNIRQSASDTAASYAQKANNTLKSAGVDTDLIAARAKDQASALQTAIEDETRNHPMRTLGIAALAGVVLGTYFTRR
jgi:ElaB/YqjD/DUF883 family membrane-anchored ribosome-binding protein